MHVYLQECMSLLYFLSYMYLQVLTHVPVSDLRFLVTVLILVEYYIFQYLGFLPLVLGLIIGGGVYAYVYQEEV